MYRRSPTAPAKKQCCSRMHTQGELYRHTVTKQQMHGYTETAGGQGHIQSSTDVHSWYTHTHTHFYLSIRKLNHPWGWGHLHPIWEGFCKMLFGKWQGNNHVWRCHLRHRHSWVPCGLPGSCAMLPISPFPDGAAFWVLPSGLLPHWPINTHCNYAHFPLPHCHSSYSLKKCFQNTMFYS